MNKIIILTTPFHLRQILLLKRHLQLSSSKNYFAVSNFINAREIREAFDNENKIHLYQFETGVLQLTYQPVFRRIISLLFHTRQHLQRYRQIVNANRKFLNLILSEIDFSNPTELILCNDRDFLSQIALSLIKEKTTQLSVTAIDEGTGYYIKETIRDKALKVLYLIISKPLLGFQYKFIEQYGTHPEIQKVYIRYPGLLPRRRKSIEYFSIPRTASDQQVEVKLGRKSILLFSTVLSEEGFCTTENEFRFYQALGNYLSQKSLGLVVKHHPREDREKRKIIRETLLNITGLEFKIVNDDIHGEELRCSNHDKILSFGSSVILSVLDSGYPPRQIITLKLRGVAFPTHIFSKTKIMRLETFLANLSILSRS